MTLDARDAAIVHATARFNQVTAAHLQQLVFNGAPSKTPRDRAIRRLTERGYLHRIERRSVGGARGGSGQYVYQLGRKGFYMVRSGRYQPARAVNYHSLAIVDSFVELLRLSREGVLAINGYSTEPDCWAAVGGVELKPDLYIDVSRPTGERLKYWLEVDMGTEGQRQLKGKLSAFWKAYNGADVREWPVFPRVVWVAVDEEREKELAWLIEQGPEEAQALFTVVRRDTLGSLFA